MREGIKAQEKVQLQLSSGLQPNSYEFEVAYEGKCLAWDSYFADITEIDHDKPIPWKILYSPTSQTS